MRFKIVTDFFQSHRDTESQSFFWVTEFVDVPNTRLRQTQSQ